MKKTLSIFAILALFSGCATTQNSQILQNPAPATQKTLPKPKINWSKDFTRKYLNDDKVRQILAVQYTGIKNIGEQSANVILYEKVKNGKKLAWREVLRSNAFVGAKGIDKLKEGDGKTPSGDYAVTGAFGILPKPQTKLEYLNIDDSVYACEDSDKYNQIVTDGTCKSGEHMIEYSPEYNYGFFIDFNAKNEVGKGSAIFFHLKGAKPFTVGCVAFDEKDMLVMLKTLEKGARVVIDHYL